MTSSVLASLALFLSAAADDPVARCRETSATREARIACLEQALMGVAPSATAAPQPPVEGLGAEQVTARMRTNREEPQRPESVDARLEDFAVTRDGFIVFFLDNGQVWRQASADGARLRLSSKRDYAVSVAKGALSGYRLTIKELRRAVLVERIK